MSEKIYAINVENGFDGDVDLMMPIKSAIVLKIADELTMELEELLGKKITVVESTQGALDEASVRGLIYSGHSEADAREIVAGDK